MTDFQIAAASLAILLEVLSGDVEERSTESSWPCNDLVLLNQVRDRVAKGEFWKYLGGLESLETQLKDGFAVTFKDGQYNDSGEPVALRFPDAIGELFTQLRTYAEAGEQVMAKADAALPILRGFVAERFVA